MSSQEGNPPVTSATTAIGASPAYQISREHCYSKLTPCRSTTVNSTFPTVVLFADRIGRGQREGKWEEEEGSPPPESPDCEIDVVSVDTRPELPYDERKVSSIMLECSRHLNLVKVPTENSDLLLERVLAESSPPQRALFSRLMRILQGDHLARLACTSTAREPIKRRLNSDKAARQFRKALSDVNWDPRLTSWSHETLLQVLDGDLLPIYLDILQVLKAKCPVLIEQMIHSTVSVVGGEAFGLLLKRPWNPVVGMPPIDKQVKFDAAPIFITLPHSTVGLGGRRWRLWQSQLSSLGRVYPILLPDFLTELGQGTSLTEFAEQMLVVSLGRVQELRSQHPLRPVILIGWSFAARLACKIAEVESVACIISLGLPATGVHHKWEVFSDPLKADHQVFSDPLKACKVPTVFAVGSEGKLSSVEYVENLRSQMSCPTSLVVVGGGDDQLRLSLEDKLAEDICQSIVDRCILEKLYDFIVNILPCSFPDEPKHGKKRKSSHVDDIGGAFLTPAVPQSPIVLASTPDDSDNSKNHNFNNSNPFLWKAFMGMKQAGRSSPASHSGSPSPISFHERRASQESLLPTKKPIYGELPKIGRPRSKSTNEKPKKWPLRLRSKSSDQAKLQTIPNSSSSFSPIPFINLAANTNANNSNDGSPPQLLAIPKAQFIPLPITPPRNPFEDPGQKLDPKTLKHLQRK